MRRKNRPEKSKQPSGGGTDSFDLPLSRARDLGAILEGQVEPTFFEAAARLKPGQPAALVESPFGLHLVKAVEARRSDVSVLLPG